MLIKIDPVLSPDLLFHLRSMGHGEKLILADANFPANTTNEKVIRLDGVGIRLLDEDGPKMRNGKSKPQKDDNYYKVCKSMMWMDSPDEMDDLSI